MTSNGTTSDFGSAFSNGFNNGKQRYGNTMTHFSDDGRLITNRDDVSFPHRQIPRNPHQNRGLPDIPDYRSYDGNRDRARRNNDRNRNDNWRDRENRREAERERDFRPRDFYNPPGNHGAGYPRREYGGGGGVAPGGSDHAPVYGRTLPLPMPRIRERGGPPTRRFDDYRSREMRPNYEKSHFPNNHDRFADRFHQHHNEQKTYDWRMPFAGNRYDQAGLVASRNHGGRYGVLATKRDAVYRERPMSWYFLVAGVLLLAAGIVNLLICVPNFYYCFLWMGPLTIVLGIVGVVHGGRYRRQCRNLYYVANGSVLAVAAMVASGLVLFQYIPLVKDITKESNLTKYFVEVEARTEQPLLKTGSTATRVWVCMTFDTVGLILVIGQYVALYAVILVAHKYWNYKNHIAKSVKPYCSPALFNPFMQLLCGELLVLTGVVSVFGCYGTEWYKYWSAVGAGVFIILTGAVSSWAAKLSNRTSVGAVAIVFNFVGIAVCGVCFAVNIMGIKENIETLNAGTDTANNGLLYASAVLFAFVLAATIICLFYCLGLLVRFSYYLTRSGYDRDAFTTSSRSSQSVSTVRRYGYEKDRGFDASSDPPLPFRSQQRTGLFGRRR